MAGRSRAAAAEPDSDEDDYVFYGTKLYDEEGLATALPTGAKADPAATRSLPVHQQVATDEQGRKRFHGAFTGGFSAGYYNTVGSKVGLSYSSSCRVATCAVPGVASAMLKITCKGAAAAPHAVTFSPLYTESWRYCYWY